MIQPLVIHNRGTVLRIELKEPRVILWINQGIYALIPIETVRNEFSIKHDKAKLSDSTPHTECVFTWNQAVVIPSETGKILVGE